MGQLRDWFEFSIPMLPGNIISAVINLQQPANGHSGPATTYTLSGLNAVPTQFSDVGGGAAYGSTTLDDTTDGTAISIALSPAALWAIEGSQGAEFLVGGVDSGENEIGQISDFANSTGAGVTLRLETSGSAPEPATAVLMLGALVGLAAIRAAGAVEFMLFQLGWARLPS